MNPTHFPQSNINFVAPPDLEESQCATISGYRGIVTGGSLDDAAISVVAWTPTERELELLKAGKPIFITFVGEIPPHYPSMSFEEATQPV